MLLRILFDLQRSLPRSGSTAMYNIVRNIIALYEPNLIAGWQVATPYEWGRLNVSVVTKVHSVSKDKFNPKDLAAYNVLITSYRPFKEAMRSWVTMNMLSPLEELLYKCDCKRQFSGESSSKELLCQWYTPGCGQILSTLVLQNIKERCKRFLKMQADIYTISHLSVAYDMDYDMFVSDPRLVIQEIGQALGYCLPKHEIDIVKRQLDALRPTGSVRPSEPHHPVTLMHGNHISGGLIGGDGSSYKRGRGKGGGGGISNLSKYGGGGGGGGGGSSKHRKKSASAYRRRLRGRAVPTQPLPFGESNNSTTAATVTAARATAAEAADLEGRKVDAMASQQEGNQEEISSNSTGSSNNRRLSQQQDRFSPGEVGLTVRGPLFEKVYADLLLVEPKCGHWGYGPGALK